LIDVAALDDLERALIDRPAGVAPQHCICRRCPESAQCWS
jgi:hypothetical protein